MAFDDAEPRRALASADDPAQDIRASFQAVLEALDAARADLHAMEREQHHSTTAQGGDLAGHPPGAVEAAVVEPLWARGRGPEAASPREAAVPSTVANGGPRYEEPSPFFTPRARPQRDMRPRTDSAAGGTPSTTPQRWAPPAARSGAPAPAEPMPPAPQKEGRKHRRSIDPRHARVAGVFGLGAVSGVLLASSLLVNEHTAPTEPPASLGQPDQPQPGSNAALPEIPGTGILRPGDSGHGVYELQVRLLQIPQIYDRGAINGQYDTKVRQAVARFQQRYGIRGDEVGVYGDNTRQALMLRTK
ncbi:MULTISPECIES: peptidoglycan-binding protein [Streptomyces]|uniref:peptidoglycan-binding protein n=1 Tax=Streptomyces TaxID=1883 RepID=UPI00292F3548|nr:peptidoglycan-binding protein [Streptomyces sp. NEAU-HV9]